MGLFDSILGAIPGVGQIASGVGIVGGLLGGSGKQGKSNNLSQQAIDFALKRYQQGGPFRSRLASLAMNLPGQRPDLSSMFADPGSPYSRSVPRLSAFGPLQRDLPVVPGFEEPPPAEPFTGWFNKKGRK